MGAPPAAHEECTADQLAAVRSLVKEGLPPYVDMSVWGPYGLRIQRKLAFTGLQLTPDGALKRT
eukprot:6352049-Amphidinium_carterae.1